MASDQTPRTLVAEFLAANRTQSVKVDQKRSALVRTPELAPRAGLNENDHGSVSRRITRPSIAASMEKSSRKLIQRYMESVDTAKPVSRYKTRASHSGRLSSSLPVNRKSVPNATGNRSLNIDADTPRTLLQNYLHNASDIIDTPHIARPVAVKPSTPDVPLNQAEYRTPSPFKESSGSSVQLPSSSARRGSVRVKTGRFRVANVKSPASSNASVPPREEDLGMFDSSAEDEALTPGSVQARQNRRLAQRGTFHVPQVSNYAIEGEDSSAENPVHHVSQGARNPNDNQHSLNSVEGTAEPYNMYEMPMESVSDGGHDDDDKENQDVVSTSSVELSMLHRSSKEHSLNGLLRRDSSGRRMSANFTPNSIPDHNDDVEHDFSSRGGSSVISYQSGQNTRQTGRWSEGHMSRFGDEVDGMEQQPRGRLSEGHLRGIDSDEQYISPMPKGSLMSGGNRDAVIQAPGSNVSKVSMNHSLERLVSGEVIRNEHRRGEQVVETEQDGSRHWTDIMFDADSSHKVSSHQHNLSVTELPSGDHSRVRHSSGVTLASDRSRQNHSHGDSDLDISLGRTSRQSLSQTLASLNRTESPHEPQQYTAGHQNVDVTRFGHSSGETQGLEPHRQEDAGDHMMYRDSTGRLSHSDVRYGQDHVESPWVRQRHAADRQSTGVLKDVSRVRHSSGETPGSERGRRDRTGNTSVLQDKTGELLRSGVQTPENKAELPQLQHHSGGRHRIDVSRVRHSSGETPGSERGRQDHTGDTSGLQDRSGRLSQSGVQTPWNQAKSPRLLHHSGSRHGTDLSRSRHVSDVTLGSERGKREHIDDGSILQDRSARRSRSGVNGTQDAASASLPLATNEHMTVAKVHAEPSTNITFSPRITSTQATASVAMGDERVTDGPAGAVSSTEDDNIWEDVEAPALQRRISDRQQKKPVKRKPRKPSMYSMPTSLVKRQFNLFAGMRVDKEAVEEVMKASEIYWDNLAKDLEAYALHAGRKTIQREDFHLLFKRQGHVNEKCSLNSLIRRHLPMEEQNKLIYVARAFNVIEPKL